MQFCQFANQMFPVTHSEFVMFYESDTKLSLGIPTVNVLVNFFTLPKTILGLSKINFEVQCNHSISESNINISIK